MQCTNINTIQFKGYPHLGLENIGQIYMWPIIMSPPSIEVGTEPIKGH